MRAHTSDRDVLWQSFIQGEYEPVRLSNPKMIIDLGANVGYSGAFFLSKYPTATVLAVEPDPDNYAICLRNLAPYGQRAKVIQGAAWPECAKLVLDKGTYQETAVIGRREWGLQPREQARMPTLRSTLMTLGHSSACVTFLKLICCENRHREKLNSNCFREILRSGCRALKNLCIELHGPDCGRFLPGPVQILLRTGAAA